jgi:hypothetical protein
LANHEVQAVAHVVIGDVANGRRPAKSAARISLDLGKAKE